MVVQSRLWRLSCIEVFKAAWENPQQEQHRQRDHDVEAFPQPLRPPSLHVMSPVEDQPDSPGYDGLEMWRRRARW
jgi:hypothetical protein